MTLDYTDCDTLTPSTDPQNPTFVDIPEFSYSLRSKDASAKPTVPKYAFINDPSNPDVSQKQRCILQFQIPAGFEPPVLLSYKLTNFFQNHRRYVKSFSAQQLKGNFVSTGNLEKSDCKPLATRDG